MTNLSSTNNSMRAIAISDQSLVLAQEELPVINADQVLIQVSAAGINRPDVFQRKGLYPAPLGASPIPGLEVSGRIVAIGSGVTQWEEGDAVCALLNGGGYAEYAVADAALCLPIPEPLGFIEAAALPETCFTVWRNLFDIGKLKASEICLIHGGSSGIGTIAIQIARELGARVFATAGSDEKCQACENLGAEKVFNYHTVDFAEALNDLLGKKGVDVTLDMVGGDYIERNISVAAKQGRIINIAFLQDSVAEVNFLPVMLKQLTLTGSTLRAQPLSVKKKIAKVLNKNIWPLLNESAIAPVIYQTLPLEKANEAHELMESNKHIGKIVLTTS